MFNMSGTEIVVILLLALVVLGPEKLPDAIRKFGRTYAELKKMSTGFQQEFKSAIDEPMREMRETADLLKRSVDLTGEKATTPVREASHAVPETVPDPFAGGDDDTVDDTADDTETPGPPPDGDGQADRDQAEHG